MKPGRVIEEILSPTTYRTHTTSINREEHEELFDFLWEHPIYEALLGVELSTLTVK